MTKPVSAVPNQFATATSTIPLSQLDSDFSTLVGYLNDLNNYSNYVADTGTANAIVLNYPSGITTTVIATGTWLQFLAANANTGSTTITVQVNSSSILSATTILNEDSTVLTANDILAGGIYSVTYNGTNWILSGGGSGGGCDGVAQGQSATRAPFQNAAHLAGRAAGRRWLFAAVRQPGSVYDQAVLCMGCHRSGRVLRLQSPQQSPRSAHPGRYQRELS